MFPMRSCHRDARRRESRSALRVSLEMRHSIFVGVVATLCLSGARAQGPLRAARASSPAAHGAVAPAAVRLGYGLKTGDMLRYKVTALFSGHFPPFAQPNGPAIHIKIVLGYVADVKKQDEKGGEVEFKVDTADVFLLEKEPRPDGSTDADSTLPFPVPVEQMQKTLNVTVRLRPDGSVTSISGGEGNAVPINLGFDIRKLFRLLMPVIFPDKPLNPNEEWSFDDGVLGQRPGKTVYKGRLLSITPAQQNVSIQIASNAETNVADQIDKSGKLTEKKEDVAGSVTGKVTVTGDLKFTAPNGTGDRYAGRLQTGKLLLTTLLTQKRNAPDPDNPDAPLESKIDVKARLFVQAQDKTPATDAGSPNKASSKAPGRSDPPAGTRKKDKKKTP